MGRTGMRRGFTLIELMIVVSIIAILAAIAIPNLIASRMQANETNAVAALREYATAQAIYRKTDYGSVAANTSTAGYYATSFRFLGGATAHVNGEGTSLKLIPPEFAAAISSTVVYSGYFFTNDASLTAVDYQFDFGLYADPAVYSKSGINSYHVNATGTVKQKDLATPGSGGSQTIDSSWIVP